jgi:hypothetical protein
VGKNNYRKNGNDGTIVSNHTPYVDGAFSCDQSLSVEDLKNNSIMVYPNPSNGLISIQMDGTFHKIQLFNTLGELVKEETNSTFSIADLTDGVYIVKVSTSSGTINQRITKN